MSKVPVPNEPDYATCPRLTGAVSTLEARGLMREMTARLDQDEALAGDYRVAHEDYLARRAELGEVPEIAGISAGGMPTRVKCLHVLGAHSRVRFVATSASRDARNAGEFVDGVREAFASFGASPEGAGTLVWRRIIERLQADSGLTQTITSDRDILDGVALSIV